MVDLHSFLTTQAIIRLQALCKELECLSHKQLRGREFATEEAEFLRHYGESLAWIMFYQGNSYVSPRDDAPRIVDVHSNKKEHLEVGIGRPRLLYVLYPWKGKRVLCRGAVLPYHEFTHAKRLTDDEWRSLLDAKPPRPPAWTKVLSDGNGRKK